ncbi:MAG: nitronate monooxygenase [Alphaproteobacteria bacterium]
MWPRTDLLDLLGIDHPIIQAPMAGSTTPALAAAVSNAGGLGSMGCATIAPDKLGETADELRAATNRSFNLNFFAHEMPVPDSAKNERVRQRVAPLYSEAGLGEPPASPGEPAFGTFDDDRLAALLDIKPAVVSFHFGLPEAAMVGALKDVGCRILCSATTVAEARTLEDAGVDAVIAQGWEAGGHRGTFHISFEDDGVGTMALVPQVVDAVRVPVIAAGGIADGRGIAAAFALGASGVQMGTAFLSCPEADVRERYREALRQADDQDTRQSCAVSGRPGRGKNTRYMDFMAEHREALPDFPLMYGYSVPLRATKDPDFDVMLYGQSAGLNRELPAAGLVATLVGEFLAARHE